MPRQPRFDLPDIPQLILHRGSNRLPCFLDQEDRRRYLYLLHRIQTVASKPDPIFEGQYVFSCLVKK